MLKMIDRVAVRVVGAVMIVEMIAVEMIAVVIVANNVRLAVAARKRSNHHADAQARQVPQAAARRT
jgi:hypothetical protein